MRKMTDRDKLLGMAQLAFSRTTPTRAEVKRIVEKFGEILHMDCIDIDIVAAQAIERIYVCD